MIKGSLYSTNNDILLTGTTIPAGTAVMTGTPAGIGLLKKPPKFLKDGDVIDIEISGIGKLTNKIVFR